MNQQEREHEETSKRENFLQEEITQITFQIPISEFLTIILESPEGRIKREVKKYHRFIELLKNQFHFLKERIELNQRHNEIAQRNNLISILPEKSIEEIQKDLRKEFLKTSQERQGYSINQEQQRILRKLQVKIYNKTRKGTTKEQLLEILDKLIRNLKQVPIKLNAQKYKEKIDNQ